MASSPTRADKASVNQSFHALMRLLRYAKRRPIDQLKKLEQVLPPYRTF